MTDDSALSDDLMPIVRFRSPLMAVAGGVLVLVCAITAYIERDSWRYYLQPGTPRELGDVGKAAGRGKLTGLLEHNTYVRLTGWPWLKTEGKVSTHDAAPGCLTGPKTKRYFVMLKDTGFRVIARAKHSYRRDELPRLATFEGRLVRLKSQPETFRMYRRFVYGLAKNCAKTELQDLCLKPMITIPTATLWKGLGKARSVLKGSHGERIEVTALSLLYLYFRYPDEYEYNLEGVTKAEALARAKQTGVPYCYLGASGPRHKFIIRAPKKAAERLLGEQKKGSGLSMSERTEGFHAFYEQLSQKGGQLTVRRVKAGFPDDYTVQPATTPGGPTLLVPVKRSGRTVRIPQSRVIKATYQGPVQIPNNAFLLIEGLKPAAARPAALTAGLCLLVSLGGIALMVLGLRRPRRS